MGSSREPTNVASRGRLRARYLLLAVTAATLGQVLAAIPASADVVNATIVRETALRTVGTTTFDPPSPDPSGIVYVPSTDRLVISDSEVEEMSIWANANLFSTTRLGALVATGNTTAYTPSATTEPAGLAYDPSSPGTRPTSGHLFVSDDVTLKIFEVGPGTDATIGTSDDVVVRVLNAGTTYGAGDAEDIAFDSDTGDLYIAEGIKAEVWRISPGTNGVFDGLPPAGDDSTSHFDIARFGAEDTEGIGYDPDRNTLLVADRNTNTVYEVHKAGLLVNEIRLPATLSHPADVTMAPASDNAGGSNLYVVTRGVDNDQNPAENDGTLYELSVPALAPISNLAPQVDAGPNQGVTLPQAAALDATVADEDLPSVTQLWEQVSGPDTATFADPTARSTSVTFPVTGTYVLKITVTDQQGLSSSDQITVFAASEGTAVLRRPVAIGYDDAEEAQNGSVAIGGSDLELVNDGATRGNQTVGVRFTNITIPRGTDVTNAYIQFQADRIANGATSLLIQGQAADNPDRFRSLTNNISSRARQGGVSWVPAPWNTPGAAGEDERTPNLEPIVQALVSRTGWRTGNAMAFIITGTGKRAAEAFDGQAPPILQVEYTDGSGNEPPMVNAGPDRQVTLPNGTTLSGSVSDDGKPIPPGQVTPIWSQVSGPQSVVFSNETSPTTDVAFTESGTYVLRLTASDGVEETTDDVTVVVAAASGAVVNLVGNPGFESGLTGWNVSGSGAGVVLSRVDGTQTAPNTGSWSGRLSNGGTASTDPCKLNDQPNWVTNATGGTYTASLWAKAPTAGKTLTLRLREYNASGTLIDNPTAVLTLGTGWQQVTVSNVAAAGASLDLQAWINNAPVGVCFYVDDVMITRT